jgi:hypothetical protein
MEKNRTGEENHNAEKNHQKEESSKDLTRYDVTCVNAFFISLFFYRFTRPVKGRAERTIHDD